MQSLANITEVNKPCDTVSQPQRWLSLQDSPVLWCEFLQQVQKVIQQNLGSQDVWSPCSLSETGCVTLLLGPLPRFHTHTVNRRPPMHPTLLPLLSLRVPVWAVLCNSCHHKRACHRCSPSSLVMGISSCLFCQDTMSSTK